MFSIEDRIERVSPQYVFNEIKICNTTLNFSCDVCARIMNYVIDLLLSPSPSKITGRPYSSLTADIVPQSNAPSRSDRFVATSSSLRCSILGSQESIGRSSFYRLGLILHLLAVSFLMVAKLLHSAVLLFKQPSLSPWAAGKFTIVKAGRRGWEAADKPIKSASRFSVQPCNLERNRRVEHSLGGTLR